MKRYLLFLFFTLLFSSITNAQLIKGKVVDIDSGKPIIYANIFIESSFIGTITDSIGHFSLDIKGYSTLPLIASSIGYKTAKFSENYLSTNLTIHLKRQDYELEEVKISPNNESREKLIKKFKREFLGTTSNGSKCEILNEEDLFPFYNEETKILHVNSSKPLIIVNKALGYKMYYFLESFKKSKSGLNYKGYCLFEELKIKNNREKRKVAEKRKLTYASSRMFFIRCLYRGSVDYNGYRLFDMFGNYIDPEEILFNLENDQKEVCFDKTIRIEYLINIENSYFLVKDECATIEKNGYFDPGKLSWIGPLSNYRVGDMLPFNYENQ